MLAQIRSTKIQRELVQVLDDIPLYDDDFDNQREEKGMRTKGSLNI